MPLSIKKEFRKQGLDGLPYDFFFYLFRHAGKRCLDKHLYPVVQSVIAVERRKAVEKQRIGCKPACSISIVYSPIDGK